MGSATSREQLGEELETLTVLSKDTAEHNTKET
jgi:hypothetical protein